MLAFASILFTSRPLFAQEAAISTFQKKLGLIKDEKKKAQVIKISEKMIDINNQKTEKMKNSLEKLNTLNDKLAKKVQRAKAKGTDTSLAEQAVANARAIIEIVQNAVVNQVAKVYSIDVVDEQTLKLEAQAVFLKMKSDLLAVNKLLIDAKQKVRVAIIEVAKVNVGKAGKKVKDATASPTLEPTIIQ